MSTETLSPWGKVAGFGLLFPLAIAASVYRAWVALALWRWFVIPLGAPSISLAHAYGLLMLWSMPQWKPKDSEGETGVGKFAGLIFTSVFLSTLTLAIAALVNMWAA